LKIAFGPYRGAKQPGASETTDKGMAGGVFLSVVSASPALENETCLGKTGSGSEYLQKTGRRRKDGK